MKVYENSSFGETRTFVVENDQPVQIIIHRDLVLNAGDIVTVKIKAFHPVLKGYFAETDRGDLFIPTDKKLIEGESVTVQVVKEARADKVATAHFPVGNKAESEMKAEEISADQADEWIDMAMARDVRLKDGGFLHIDRTRVCWTIDVDSGESRDSLTEINQCAAPEVVHQIVLKNMGGMILVDFAGSKRGKVAKTLETQMKQAFAGCVFAAKITLNIYLAHIVHCGGDGGFDAWVDSGSVDCHSAKTANSYNANAFRVNIFAC